MSENSNPQLHIAVCDDDPIDRQQAAALRELGDSTAIIFISSNRDMALRGYEVSAARYLAKPLRTEQLREALLYCYKMFCEKKEILLPTTKGQRRISLSNILYAEAMERVTKLALPVSKYRSASVRGSLSGALVRANSTEIPALAATLNLPFKMTSNISFPLCATGRIVSFSPINSSRYTAVYSSVVVCHRSRKCFIISWRSIITCSICRRRAS